MSQMINSIPPEEYTPDKGKFIAEAFSKGDPLREICKHSNGWLPAMLYVRRWRSMFPAFDALMMEAGACRAENMAEDMLDIADDCLQQAAHNRNRLQTREKLAGWLAPREYGSGKQVNDPGDSDQAPVYMLTDDQLMAIAAGKLVPALEGECERVEAEGVHPPLGHGPTPEYEVSGTKKPESNSEEPSVTTNGNNQECAHGSFVCDNGDDWFCERCGIKMEGWDAEIAAKFVIEHQAAIESKFARQKKISEKPARSFVGME